MKNHRFSRISLDMDVVSVRITRIGKCTKVFISRYSRISRYRVLSGFLPIYQLAE
nr:MAG TPA: hypothetical protein [Caudoviricetes sp.]